MVNLPDDEAELFEPGTLFLSEVERRRDLEMAGREAAIITIDLQDRGPLYKYVVERRNDSAAALQALIDISPSDVDGISKLQARVKQYVDVCEWVYHTLQEADNAEQIIKEEYGNHGEAQD